VGAKLRKFGAIRKNNEGLWDKSVLAGFVLILMLIKSFSNRL